MNFFESQDRARRKSALLLFYFVMAVILIALAINAIAWISFSLAGEQPTSFLAWIKSANFWKFALATLTVIGAGSLIQYLKLRSGGEAVAKMVGATAVNLQTQNLAKRRFINVVEEMSIAAGVVMPQLYIMEREPSINAFVAGYQPNQAVMVITQGALEQLDRDELQGVVGHEFSHVLNGDMRLNVRLIAILAGILLLGQLGEFLLRSTRHVSRSKDGAKAAPALLIAGLGLMIVGYIGLFFGRLIKSALSRQREYLADASSVQFTRNPQGLASALNRIRESSDGSVLSSTLHAEDMNHMCFGETIHLRFRGLFASHPPLEDRIRAIDALFVAKARAKRNQEKISTRQNEPAVVHKEPSLAQNITLGAMSAGLSSGAGLVSAMGAASEAAVAEKAVSSVTGTTNAARVWVEQIGQPQTRHQDYAAKLTQRWPDELLQLIHSPSGAIALVSAILIVDMDQTDHKRAMQWIGSTKKTNMMMSDLEQALALLPPLGAASRLPIIELCLATLKQLTPEDRKSFLEMVEDLIRMDQRYTLVEFVVLTILRKQLATDAGCARKVLFHSFKPVLTDIGRVVAVLSRVGGQSKDEITQTYLEAMRNFSQQTCPVPGHCSLAEFSTSLNRLAALSPLLKQPLLESCADVVLRDRQIRIAEYELLRAIAAVLDCPMPPLVAEQEITDVN